MVHQGSMSSQARAGNCLRAWFSTERRAAWRTVRPNCTQSRRETRSRRPIDRLSNASALAQSVERTAVAVRSSVRSRQAESDASLLSQDTGGQGSRWGVRAAQGGGAQWERPYTAAANAFLPTIPPSTAGSIPSCSTCTHVHPSVCFGGARRRRRVHGRWLMQQCTSTTASWNDGAASAASLLCVTTT